MPEGKDTGGRNDFERRLDELSTRVRVLEQSLSERTPREVVRRLDELEVRWQTEVRRYLDILVGEVRKLGEELHPLIYQDRSAPWPSPDDPSPYFGFARRFRGPEELIKERHRLYLPLFKGKKEIIDLCSGRGEFLELLREDGFEGIGVDLDSGMVERCREKGLRAEAGDAVLYLSRRESESADGIFSAQCIEHLDAEDLFELFRQSRRVLRPGGVLVAETLNPYNLAAFRFFWLDPTHKRPLYPEYTEFLARAAGFSHTEIRYMPCFGDSRAERQAPWDY